MARLSTPLLQFTVLSLLCVLFSLSTVSAQTASGGSVLVTATTNGTYTKPTQSATSTTGPHTTASNSPATTSAVNGVSTLSMMGASGGNALFALLLAGLFGGAVLGL